PTRPPTSPLFPYTTLFRSGIVVSAVLANILESVFHIGEFESRSWSLVVPSMPDWTLPDLSLIGQVSIFGAFSKIGVTAASLLALDRKSTRLNSSHVKISYA